MKVRSIPMTDEMWEWLREQAHLSKRSIASLVRECVHAKMRPESLSAMLGWNGEPPVWVKDETESSPDEPADNEGILFGRIK